MDFVAQLFRNFNPFSPSIRFYTIPYLYLSKSRFYRLWGVYSIDSFSQCSSYSLVLEFKSIFRQGKLLLPLSNLSMADVLLLNSIFCYNVYCLMMISLCYTFIRVVFRNSRRNVPTEISQFFLHSLFIGLAINFGFHIATVTRFILSFFSFVISSHKGNR